MTDVTNPITEHEVYLTPMGVTPQANGPSGWIRLLNGNVDAGYINLVGLGEQPLNPRIVDIGATGSKYIVIYMPYSDVFNILYILRNQGPLQIRFTDRGTAPFAIIEPTNAVPGAMAR